MAIMEHRIKKGAQGYAEPVKGKPGTFRLYFSLGKDPNTGRYLRSPKKTIHCQSKNPKNWHSECIRKLDEYRNELEGTKDSSDSELTVSEYALDFHRTHKDAFSSPLSYEREGDYIRHITDLFGDILLSELEPNDIKHIYAKALEDGMSEAELHGTHVKLRQIMQDAVDNEIIDRNPCSSIKLSKPIYNERKPLSAEEASRLLGCLLAERSDPKAIGTIILLECGLRKGEMLGLCWADFDSENRALRIERQYTNDHSLRAPKTKTSNRTIAISETLTNLLNEWKSAQKAQLGNYSIGQHKETPIVNSMAIVTTREGMHAEAVRTDPHNYSRWFRDFCVDNGFGSYEHITKRFYQDGKEHIRGSGYSGLVPHALRHTQATLLIGEGMDVKTVQARLGHSSPRTTLNIYSHAIDANDRRAADDLDAILSQNM